MTKHGRSGADAPSGLRPFGAEPAAQSQAKPLVPNAAWRAIGFVVNTDQGPCDVAGWSNGTFALDFRVWGPDFDCDGEDGYAKGWLLTHLPTGFSAFGILGPLTEAKRIADRTMQAADWSFGDPSAARAIKPTVEAIKAEFGDKLVFRRPQFGPLFEADASGTPTRRAETTGSVGEADGGPAPEGGDAQP